jgi:hypothetical protein
MAYIIQPEAIAGDTAGRLVRLIKVAAEMFVCTTVLTGQADVHDIRK